jgi:ATP-dependent DNA helicase RecG
MAAKEFKIGNKYSPRELMELAVEEMGKSIPDPNRDDQKPNPKVGAVIATQDGILIGKSHRGELRIGDHAEYTAIERHHRGSKLDGYVIYATLEPCAPGARNHPKLSCAERIINARIAKVYIGTDDPDPSVAGQGREALLQSHIEVDYFDKDLYEIIYKENKQFFDDATIRAKEEKHRTLTPAVTELTKELTHFDFASFSDEAQQEMVNRMNLGLKIGSEAYFVYLLQLGFLYRPPRSKAVKPTGLGLLMLGRNPQIEFEQARIKFTIEASVGDTRILDIEGPLMLMPEKAEQLLDLTFLPEINRENFHREEIVDISKTLLRELIINAIVHRDYSIRDKQIRVVASKEKIEIWSPGEPIVSLDKFRTFEVPSISRNPKIAYIFFQSGLMEERGIGMRELKAFKEKNQLPDPVFRMVEGYFVISVFRKRMSAADMPPQGLKVEELEGYKFIQSMGTVSKGEYAKHFGIDDKKAQRQLSRLLEQQFIKREGKGPSTVYVFIKRSRSQNK